MASSCLLAVDQIVTGNDLKTAAARWNQNQFFDGLSVLVKEFARQTDGFGGVVSSSAVFDTDLYFFHGEYPFLCMYD